MLGAVVDCLAAVLLVDGEEAVAFDGGEACFLPFIGAFGRGVEGVEILDAWGLARAPNEGTPNAAKAGVLDMAPKLKIESDAKNPLVLSYCDMK